MQKADLIHSALSFKIVGLAMEVHRGLGYGFLEKVYENSLMVLLAREGFQAEQSVKLKVMFNGAVVGDYEADIVVDGKVIVEIKAAKKIDPAHRAQTLNYLKATGLRLGILLNFGRESMEFERLVFGRSDGTD